VPTRKQRRRRAKERRHEWEEVYLDEEGREIAPDEVGELEKPAERRDGRRESRGPARRGRTMEPPSWRRVGKRALIFAPLMFVVITIFDPQTSVAARVLYTLQLMVLFVPFSYLVDTIGYRMYRKRVERVEGGAAPRGGHSG
jgi:hypothetical protein